MNVIKEIADVNLDFEKVLIIKKYKKEADKYFGY